MRIWLGLLPVVTGVAMLGACGGADASSDYMDDIPPNGCQTEGCPATDGTSTSTSGTSDGTGGGDACKSSAECSGDAMCVAPYDGDQRGDYACVAECVDNDDAAKWCADDAACCDPQAMCTMRGLCEVAGATSTSTSTGTGP